MPKQIGSLQDYREDIAGRSQKDRSEAIDRHREYLKSIDGFTTQRLAHSKLIEVEKSMGMRNSGEFEAILGTLRIIDRVMDGLMTEEVRAFSMESLLDSYATLMMQCDTYLAHHSSRRFTKAGKHRVETIRNLRQLVDDEAQMVHAALSETNTFEGGITLRQLLAGMRPLKEAVPEASQAAIPQAVEFGPEQSPEVNDPIRNLSRIRDTLKKDQTVDANTRAILDVLLEQINRARLDGYDSLGAELIDRVVDLCSQGEEGGILVQLAETARAYQSELHLESTSQDTTFQGTRMKDDEQFDWKNQGDMMYPEYRYLSPQVARYLASNVEINRDGSAGQAQIYGANSRGVESEEGMAHGYILTSHSSKINTYLRKLHDRSGYQDDAIHKSFRSLTTISTLDQAAAGTPLPEKTRLHRLLNAPYLQYVFGMDSPSSGLTVSPEAAQVVNKQAGKIVTDSNFMCTGFAADTMFLSNPIMLTLLCDEGTRVFPTGNLAEGEIILGRNTSYMILGAVMRGKDNAVRIPASHLNRYNQYMEGGESVAEYQGLEIFAKVIRNQEPVTSKAQSPDAFHAFTAKQISYEGLYGSHGNGVHRNAYLQMARADQASLDEQEAAAMDEYTNDSANINKRLRSGVVEHDVTDTQNIFMKRAFAKHPIPVDMTTYRGVSDGFLTFLMSSNSVQFPDERCKQLIQPDGTLNHSEMQKGGWYKQFEGMTFKDDAFVSTSTNKYFARRWANMVRHNEEAAKYRDKTDADSQQQLAKHTGHQQFSDIRGAHVLNMKLPAGTRAMFVDTMFTRTGRARGQDELTLDAGYTYRITRVEEVGPGMLEMDVECLG